MAGKKNVAPDGSGPPKLLVVVVLLSIAGIGFSIELTRIHRMVHTNPDFHSICALSEGINCEIVAQSPYSAILGLPVSVWGIIGYTMSLVAALWGVGRWRLHAHWPRGGLALLHFFLLLASLGLGYISLSKIDSVCLFCIACYGVNLALAVLAVISVRSTGLGLLGALAADLRAVAAQPLFAGALAALIAAAVVILELTVEPYWECPPCEDLPVLPHGIDQDGFHWIGAEIPELTIVEFSDYQCSHCRRAHKLARNTAAQYPDRVRLIHRHLPLDQTCNPAIRRKFHEHACKFARAAECAGLQDAFWEMNDQIWSLQDTMKAEDLDVKEIAVRLGLDRSRFVECLEGDQVESQIARDVDEALERGLRGTPTFIIDDQIFPGRVPPAELDRLLRQRQDPDR